ncbi:TetR/AcrR family transcriptional regulator [Pseudarthrobacter oxydans]|jgi:AcrR family transcriptional regulator|uniref:AcrR family transcriptional regulator n=1 Tax=Pseudarthrobacter oxydans TaxID=1671 RepID=A0AAW8N917_PSEOX|nr:MULTISPECIES: TetR/AcrR family transcriptional regulator [Pseudarthrobacter]MBA4103510.1 TetR family transcriptional regulator [Arthrobacter sp.]MDV2976999.1 TetR/AcrR family transcriptional regulator [Actinomycetes bacterium ARC8]WHP58318.1 TetR/AcrR family transcriptional regulator [Arthrobacter sp. KFRI-F3372]MDR6791088.1 AcrR family transcriptional regulator [Pseudarthrobacter oxydans]MDR7162483.1 AcrR family transcriptional regulator [Pseudarthrobacter oxydans]
MARPTRDERKAELLAAILDYLMDKTLAELTFRSLADGLGMSAYVLVYHFGSRDQLINDIVVSIESRLDRMRNTDVRDIDRAAWRDFLLDSWQWTMAQRNRHLTRLEFEATAQDIVAAEPRGTSQEHFRMLHHKTRDWLMVQGIPEEFADTDARLFTSTFYGLQFDFVVMNEPEAATKAFELMLTVFFNNLETRLAAGGQGG